jgi:uncharacterized protein YkwD
MFAAALALGACSPSHFPQTPGGPPVFSSRLNTAATELPLEAGLFHRTVLRLVNQVREAAGRPPLRHDLQLLGAAQMHANNMAALGQHSHQLPVVGQSRLSQRMNKNGVRYRVAGENIAMDKLFRLTGRPISTRAIGCAFTYADTREAVPVHTAGTLAESAVRRWMASPKHRDSILRADFQRMGSGFSVDPKGSACGDVYLVQTFAG